ncbi:claudin 15-like a [Alosa sapidissima]|uniref:claudin 15-like a n=1 Tax=Alosa sapidissima TaxID=34773 RepID=UPI001C08F6EC|nr:claudin 15-like a [Alosa sapidissima]
MSTALEAVGFFMSVASWLIVGTALGNDYWKVSSFSGSVIISNRQYENLWHSCAEDSSGVANCRDFESMLALPGHIQACRALMVVSLLLALVSIVLSVMGLKCIKLGSTTEQGKAKIAATGGILFVLSGVCDMVAVSWYAARVVEDWNNPFYGGIKFEPGAGLYIGWAGGILAIIGGAIMCCACKRVSGGAGGGGGYPAAKIYKSAAASESGTRTNYV